MQLKKITIHNIASIEDAEIDFSGPELGKAPIFLICGETGAGKTTILDAICLALYGDTPRMTSVSKEELELSEPSDNRLEKYYSNDNSQLLHRGAGEGFARLLFTGNDEHDYEAVWEVHRAHNKAHKRLMRPTRTLCAIDGSYSENRLNEIKTKIIELTGLDYDQFCRTVMLAQGEFTKFLKSNRAEKSEILEKLTGTEIYSRLGIRIAEKYNEAKSNWQRLRSEIERIRLIDLEELDAMKKMQEDISKELTYSSSILSEITAKMTWLDIEEKNDKNIAMAEHDVLILKESVMSDSFVKDKALVNDYELSGEGRSVVINIEKNEKNMMKIRENIPVLQLKRDNLKEQVHKKQESKTLVESKLAKKEEELEKADIEGIAKKYDSFLKEENLLSALQRQIEKEAMEHKQLDYHHEQFKECSLRIKDYQRQAEDLNRPIEEASLDLKKWTQKLERAELSASDLIKDIRARLRQGDVCPVCGTTVDKEIKEEYFDSLLTPIRESKNDAEVKYRELKTNRDAILKLIDSESKSFDKLKLIIIDEKEVLQHTEAELIRLKSESGLEKYGISDIESRRKMISEETERLSEKRKSAQGIQKDLKNYKTQLKTATNELEKEQELLYKIEVEIKEMSATINALENSRNEMWEELRIFFIKNPNITMQRIKDLSEYNKEEMLALKNRLRDAEDRLKLETGKLEALKKNKFEHEANKPVIKENDTKDNLVKQKNELESRIREQSEVYGRISEALDKDKEQRKEVEILQEKCNKAREEYDKWEGLYNKLGDLKGTKFRAVAQSFILRSLLENANLYMKRFNDRYTLTCNPGTLAILVKDAYKPSDPQPSSILSGGESFMASLSLALALSNLRSGGATSDILFIDEGFGTLSGEYLGNVMDTLERLHQIGGRKVGLISHVMEMKERIPVQIRVKRESPALSKIEVVESY